MDAADHWHRVEELFHAALDLDAEGRSAFLEQACGQDLSLRKEVESLLDSADKPIDFIPQAVFEIAKRISVEDIPKPIPPGTQLSHYKIISMLGEGGMGQVYLAEDLQLRRKVALKMLSPRLTGNESGLRRFEQEAYAASALNHPNILTIYEFGQADGLDYIASEFIDGITLRQRMWNGGIDLNETIDLAIQIASALVAAHAAGIVHRDIKPENVIVRNDGIVKVLDFGIAKLSPARVGQTIRQGGPAVAVLTTEPGVVRGTARYMSPEQSRGVAVDARSDIFSLGSVLYELVTGRVAFEGDTPSDVMAEILKTEPRPPAEFVPNMPPEIERVIAKALRKDRAERYQTVAELLADLQNFKREAEFQAKLHQPVVTERGKIKFDDETTERGQTLSWDKATSSRRWRLWQLALVLAIFVAGYFGYRKMHAAPITSQQRSLAVLPFRNLNGDPKTDFLGFSLADEIITKLGYVNSLTVRPSSSVDKYRDKIIDPKKVAEDLDVDTLLTGSFIKDGDYLRINTQLIDVKPDKILWRESLDVKYENLLTVQDRVAQRIIKGLELNLSPAEAANLKPEKPITAIAYEDYLRGIDFYSLNDFADSIEMLEKATALEPNYAPAWAQLGRAYTTSGSLQFGGREQYLKAQAAYEKAIALNPALVEPRIFMANLLTDTGRVEQAVPLLRSVLQSSPNNAEAHWELGYAFRFAGMLKESVAECEKARQNNPQVKISSSAINSYLYMGQYQAFLDSLPASDSAYILFYRGLAEYYLNHRDQAAKDFDTAYERNPSLLPVEVGKAISYSIRHDAARGLKLLRQTEDKIEERGVSDPEGIYKVAQAYALLGDKSAALHMLRHSIGDGFFCYPYMVRDPLLQSIHGEPEFKALLEQARSRHEQFKRMFF